MSKIQQKKKKHLHEGINQKRKTHIQNNRIEKSRKGKNGCTKHACSIQYKNKVIEKKRKNKQTNEFKLNT